MKRIPLLAYAAVMGLFGLGALVTVMLTAPPLTVTAVGGALAVAALTALRILNLLEAALRRIDALERDGGGPR